jgi:hypothetical protein
MMIPRSVDLGVLQSLLPPAATFRRRYRYEDMTKSSMRKIAVLGLFFSSLPLAAPAVAYNKNSVARSNAILQNKVSPKIGAATPRLAVPNQAVPGISNSRGGYYSLGAGQRRRAVPLPKMGNDSQTVRAHRHQR